MRIGIDKAANSAVLGRNFRFDAAPGEAVTCQRNGALHRDTHTVQFFVVFRAAVVDIDYRRGDVAIDRVGVVCG